MDIQKMMKKAQEMQQKMQEAQSELEAQEFIGTSGGGGYAVKVSINGKGVLKHCEIDDNLMTDKEMLEDLIVAATNNAKSKADDAMGNIMKNLGISPDMLGG